MSDANREYFEQFFRENTQHLIDAWFDGNHDQDDSLKLEFLTYGSFIDAVDAILAIERERLIEEIEDDMRESAEKKKLEANERLSKREKDSLLRIIYVLAKVQYGDISQHYSIATNILKDAAEKGLKPPLGDDQLAAKIKEAIKAYEQG